LLVEIVLVFATLYCGAGCWKVQRIEEVETPLCRFLTSELQMVEKEKFFPSAKIEHVVAVQGGVDV
jgi:hypothetical protein